MRDDGNGRSDERERETHINIRHKMFDGEFFGAIFVSVYKCIDFLCRVRVSIDANEWESQHYVEEMTLYLYI